MEVKSGAFHRGSAMWIFSPGIGPVKRLVIKGALGRFSSGKRTFAQSRFLRPSHPITHFYPGHIAARRFQNCDSCTPSKLMIPIGKPCWSLTWPTFHFTCFGIKSNHRFGSCTTAEVAEFLKISKAPTVPLGLSLIENFSSWIRIFLLIWNISFISPEYCLATVASHRRAWSPKLQPLAFPDKQSWPPHRIQNYLTCRHLDSAQVLMSWFPYLSGSISGKQNRQTLESNQIHLHGFSESGKEKLRLSWI